MQIVIDISEQDYYNALQYATLKSNTDFENLMICAVQNGTPLPKGHGRLIDADKFVSDHFGEAARLVDDALPIIEADTESEG